MKYLKDHIVNNVAMAVYDRILDEGWQPEFIDQFYNEVHNKTFNQIKNHVFLSEVWNIR